MNLIRAQTDRAQTAGNDRINHLHIRVGDLEMEARTARESAVRAARAQAAAAARAKAALDAAAAQKTSPAF